MVADTDETRASPRILLVEDNFLVGSSLRTMLEGRGFRVTGPAATVGDGLTLAREGEFEGAVLDINIIGGTSAPIADLLQARDCPVVFVTGYGSPNMLPASLLRLRRLNKPIDGESLEAALRDVIG